MIKFLRFCYFTIIFTAFIAQAQTYQLTGNPVNTAGWTLVPQAVVNTDFIQLTSDNTSQFGVIKLNNPINLKYCDKWKVEFDFRIDGNGTASYGKGDGFAFWYLANPPSGFVTGAGLGIPANSTGLMVGFDIFNNTTEAQMSKVHLLYGVNNVGGNNIEYNNTAGSTFHSPDLYATMPFQNGNYRHVEVNGQVDPANLANWIISIKIDGTLIVNQSFAPSGAAATMAQGYFGFSAATGAATARHAIKNAKIYVDKVPLLQNSVTPANLCPDAVSGLATVNLTSFNSQFTATPANYSFTYYVQGTSTPIANPANYQFSANQVISVLIQDNSSTFCDNPDAVINLTINPIPKNDAALQSCPANGTAIFDLTSANVTTLTPVTKKYYPTLADAQAGTSEITNPGSYTSAPAIVYVKITSATGCVGIAKITLSFYPLPTVNDAALTTCFIPGNETMGLFDLTTANVSTQSGITKKFYTNLNDAVAGINQIANPTAYIAATGFAYVKVINANGCGSVAKITLTVTPPKYSAVLKDKIICAEDTTILDAGTGFTSYLWSTGATTQSISNVGVGNYWVDLKFGQCTTRQQVKVLASAMPVITNVLIENNTATIQVSGGTPPYQFSTDGIVWQNSNVLLHLPRGEKTFYVKDTYDCEPVSATITVPNLLNIITPNGDGYNDNIDYSALAYKKNLVFTVYDRYGNKIFIADKNTHYKWDGTSSGRKVYTGTYWYSVNWEEPRTAVPVQFSGWVMVKNRD